MTKYAQSISVPQSWLRKWVSKLFPSLTKTQELTCVTAEAVELSDGTRIRKNIEAYAIYEQVNFGTSNVQIEKDCKLISKLPSEKLITIYAGKKYWVTFKAPNK